MMRKDLDKKIDLSKLPGIVESSKFEEIAKSQTDLCHKNHTYFSIVNLSFDMLNHKEDDGQRNEIIEFIADCICKNTNKEADHYTLNSSKFSILLANKTFNAAYITISKVIEETNRKFPKLVGINVGIAEYPQDGKELSDMLDSAEYLLEKSQKEKVYHHKSTHISLQNWQNELNHSIAGIDQNSKAALFKVLNSMINNIAKYDRYLAEHSALVTKGSAIFAAELKLSKIEIEKIAIASLLHDIGYIAIPKEIFNKPQNLSPDEWKFVKLHPTIACEYILKGIPVLKEYLSLIQNHHEFLDGSGYPKGKKADQIPIGSQIISIVDSYQAMNEDRPYRPALSFEDIIDIYIQNAGIKWDQNLITIFTAIIAEEKMRKKLTDKGDLSLKTILS